MTEVFLENGDDPELARLASEIIDALKIEIQMMEKWVREEGG